jgi:glucose-1-phosphate thymidylyltransferase
MKGIILAGGQGTRLFPLTAVTNKHLVPVGNIPMIEYPLHTLSKTKIESLSVVTGGEHFKQVSEYLSRMHPEINFSFHYQREAGGIAQALGLTEPFVHDSKLAVILGDNVFEEDVTMAAKYFTKTNQGAILFLKKVPDPTRFGIAEIKGNKIISIEEKPKEPKSDLAVTGLYFYDQTVFEKIRRLKPSARGELEITDVNNLYLQEGRLGFRILDGFWSDAGTFESRKRCEEYVSEYMERRVSATLPKF